MNEVQRQLQQQQEALEDQRKAEEAQRKALQEQRRAEESVRQAEDQQRAAVDEVKKQEDAYFGQLSSLEKKKEDTNLGQVARSKAAAGMFDLGSLLSIYLRTSLCSF